MWILVSSFALAIVFLLPDAASAQMPGAPPSCRQLWEEANAEAARAALDAARSAGGAGGAAASRWADAWVQAWKAAWAAQGAALSQLPGQGCCNNGNWYEMAALAGKSAWDKAWQSAGALTGADKTWADKYAAAFADAWARAWFVHYPLVCAKAGANATAAAFADAKVWTKVTAFAWADATAGADAFADAEASSFAEAWGTAAAAAWAAAGATAEAQAMASAQASAAAAVSGDCAIARASACAQAAAAAFASAWANAGAHAFADAYAAAWADAVARAYANAWAIAWARADAKAFAAAFASAASSGYGQAFAAAWREKLANQGQLPAIVNWWSRPGAAMPPLKSIQKLMALAYRSALKIALKAAFAAAVAKDKDWDAAVQRAQKDAVADASSWATSWTSVWAESWAYSWATAWMETYIAVCARAAAAVCKECPCTTTTTTTRPRTVSRPSGFTYTLVGLGVTAGSVFEIHVQNTTGDPIVVEVPAGTVFRPSDPDHQRMIIADDQHIPVPANQSAQAPLQGYCLDYGKQPPPAGTLGSLHSDPVLVAALDPTISLAASLIEQGAAARAKYQVDEDPGYVPFLRIIRTGNRLAAEGKLHTDLPPDRYKAAVIQRALWTFATRGSSAPHTRDTLLNDIRRQVKDSGGAQTDDQIQELASHLGDDVDAVLRAAGVS